MGAGGGSFCRVLQEALTTMGQGRLVFRCPGGDALRIDPSTAQVQALASAPVSQRRERVGARFSLDIARDNVRSSIARAAISLGTMDAVLALQGEQEDPAERRRRKTAKRGTDILDALDGLKAALLGGRVAPADLRRVVTRLRDGFAPSGDPGLDRIMAEIELRAEVELAKLAVAGIVA